MVGFEVFFGCIVLKCTTLKFVRLRTSLFQKLNYVDNNKFYIIQKILKNMILCIAE